MSAEEIIGLAKDSGLGLWAEDGKLVWVAGEDLTDEQIAFLREHKAVLIDYLTTPHGNRYLWRYCDPHNIAGWRVHYSHDDDEQVRTLFGESVEVRPTRPAQDFQKQNEEEGA